jgi:hypothetical protein
MAGPVSAVLRGERVIVDTGTGVLVRPGDGPAIGRVALRGDGAALVIEALCIDDALRGYGAGSEAARLLEAYARAGPWETLRAWAPPGLGLAVYFWSRMGLRPVFGERAVRTAGDVAGAGGVAPWHQRPATRSCSYA